MAYPFVQSYTDLGLRKGPILGFCVHMAEGGGTVGYLSRSNPNGVSVHYVIEYTGRTVQMLLESHMHSSIRSSAIRQSNDANGFYGVSAARAVLGDWAAISRTLGPNHATIAVEIEGFAANGPNAAQAAALTALVADLRRRHTTLRGNVGHRDFADYKACPGGRIPWSAIGGHGLYGGAPLPGGSDDVEGIRFRPRRSRVVHLTVDPTPGVKVVDLARRTLYEGSLVGGRDVAFEMDIDPPVTIEGNVFSGLAYGIGVDGAAVLERNARDLVYEDPPLVPTTPDGDVDIEAVKKEERDRIAARERDRIAAL